jgi:hypothetical protein
LQGVLLFQLRDFNFLHSIMPKEQTGRLANHIGFGKKLPTAVYIARPQPGWPIGAELITEIRRAEVAAKPDLDWNLLKIHTNEAALTFLTYPDFDEDPHPTLAEATKINLNTGSVVRTDYRGRSNPPILHRKETFLPAMIHASRVSPLLPRKKRRPG